MTVELRTLRVSAELDASKYTSGAAQVSAAGKEMAAVNTAVAQSQTKISQAGDVLSRLSRQYVDGYASAQRFNSALAQLSKGMDVGKIKMAEAIPILDGIYRKYGLIGDAAQFAAKGQAQLATAITAANAKLIAQRQITPSNQNRLSSGQMQGLGYQANDVITMALLGAPVSQIAVSQGGQILQSLQQGEGGIAGSLNAIKASAAGAAAALATTLGPLGLIAVGFAAAATAAGAYYLSTRDKAKTLEEVLKQQTEALHDLANAYGIVASKAKDAFSYNSREGVGLSVAASINELKLNLQSAAGDVVGGTGRFITPGKSAGGYFAASAEFKEFNDAIVYLQKTAREGTPDILGFKKMVEDRWALDPNNAALTAAAAKLEELAKNSVSAARALKEVQKAQEELARSLGPGGLPLRRGPLSTENMGGYEDYQREYNIQRDRQDESAWADFDRMRAKSPQEIYDATKRQQEAIHNDSESPAQRADRVRIESTKALAAAEYQLIEAQKERARSLEATIAASQLDLDLIGKTTGEQAALRMEFEKTQELRQQAAQNGIEVDQKELDLIHQKAVEYGRLAEAIQKTNLLRDIQFERDQLTRSPGEQAIASRLRGTSFGMDSDVAGELRYNQQFTEVRDGVKGFLGDIADALVNGGDDIGEALGKAVLGGLTKILDQMLDQVLTQLANSIAQAILGGGPSSSSFNVANASGGLSVVGDFMAMLTGGGGGSSVGRHVGGAGSGGANFAGSMSGSMAQYAQAIKDVESGGGNYSALGPMTARGDRAYGAYQVMGSNIPSWTRSALGHSMTPGDFLHDRGAQDAVFQQQFGRSISKFGSPQDAASVWFTGRPMGAGAGNARDILGTTGTQYVQKFNTALGKLSDTTSSVTKDVGGLGKVSADATQGIGEFGNALSKFPAAPGGGGGFMGGAGSGGMNFGGGFPLPSFDFMNSISPLATTFIMGGGVGLFHEGGIAGAATRMRYGIDPRVFIGAPRYHSGGIAGDEVPAILRRGEPVFKSMEHARQATGGGAPRISVIVNNKGAPVHAEQGRTTTNPDGSISVEVMMDAMENRIAKRGTQPGTPISKMLDTRNARQAPKRYG